MNAETVRQMIKPGARFDTPYEVGCVAIETVDRDGSFGALDSDCVECGFHVDMVTRIYA